MQDERAWPTSGFLTRDNSYLSRPKPGLAHDGVVDRTDLPEAVAGYVRDSLAENTRRAYSGSAVRINGLLISGSKVRVLVRPPIRSIT